MMTSQAWVFLISAGVLAGLGWLASWQTWRPVVMVARPAAMGGLIGVALWLLDVDRTAQTFVIAGLAVNALGDLLLAMPRHYFASGSACFLAARVFYSMAFVALGVDAGAFVLVLIVAGFTLLTVGRILMGQIRRLRPGLVAGTAAYMAAAASTVALGVATGDPTAGFGAVTLALSDVLLGWHRFVRALAGGHGSIHIVAHVAQAILVLALVTA